MRALVSHQCGPDSNPGVDAICGLSLLLVLSLAPRGFSPGTPVFPSPQKPTFPNSNSTRNQVDEEPLCGCTTCKSLFIYLFNFILYLAIEIANSVSSSHPSSPTLRASSPLGGALRSHARVAHERKRECKVLTRALSRASLTPAPYRQRLHYTNV